MNFPRMDRSSLNLSRIDSTIGLSKALRCSSLVQPALKMKSILMNSKIFKTANWQYSSASSNSCSALRVYLLYLFASFIFKKYS